MIDARVEGDLGPGLGVFYGIGQQVHQDLVELARLTHDGRQVLGRVALEGAPLEHRLHLLADVLHHRRNVDAREVDGDTTGVDPAHREDVPDQSLHPVGLAMQVLEELTALRFRQVKVEQQLAQSLERGQRCFQLVRGREHQGIPGLDRLKLRRDVMDDDHRRVGRLALEMDRRHRIGDPHRVVAGAQPEQVGEVGVDAGAEPKGAAQRPVGRAEIDAGLGAHLEDVGRRPADRVPQGPPGQALADLVQRQHGRLAVDDDQGLGELLKCLLGERSLPSHFIAVYASGSALSLLAAGGAARA